MVAGIMRTLSFVNNSYLINKAAMTLTILLLFSSGAAALAQTAVPARKPDPITEINERIASTTSEFITTNGLKTIHRYIPENESVSVQIYFRGGSRNLTEKNAGIETLLWEAAQNGTKNFSKGQLNREIARMGTVVASASGYDYSVVALKSVRQHFDRSWQLLTDILINPTFDEKEVALEREQMMDALRQEKDDPDVYVKLASNQLMYRAHPYVNPPDGTVESIGNLKADDLRKYHASQLITSRMLIVVVGNITLEELRRKVDLSFGKLPKGDYQPASTAGFQSASKPDLKVISREVPTAHIRGVFAAPALGDKDYAAMFICQEIIGQIFHFEVRQRRNLSYAPLAELSSTGSNTGSISVTTARPNEAIEVMLNIIDNFGQRKIIDDRYMPEIIGDLLTGYYQKMETSDSQAARLGEYELIGGGWRRSLTWLEDLRRVTADDLQRVARTYLKNFQFAAIGNPKDFDNNLFLSK
jgi:zinc protease